MLLRWSILRREKWVTDYTVRFYPSSLQSLFYDKRLTIVKQGEEGNKEEEEEAEAEAEEEQEIKKWILKRLSK